jgi:hypothetical protein
VLLNVSKLINYAGTPIQQTFNIREVGRSEGGSEGGRELEGGSEGGREGGMEEWRERCRENTCMLKSCKIWYRKMYMGFCR